MTYDVIIVGGGRMGSAVALGLLAAPVSPVGSIGVIQHGAAKAADLAKVLAPIGVHESLDIDMIGSDTGVVLCVKPDYAESVCRHLSSMGVTRLLSVVAGLTTARLEAAFTMPVAVIRSMPNTPVVIRQGVSALSGGANCTKADLDWAESILAALGTVVRLPESKMDAVAALSGAMPAYLYLVVESLIEAGVHQGLPRDVSTRLVVDTFAGSGSLLKSSELSPEQLRHQVTSPGGLTAAGLRMLEGRAVRGAFLEAVAAAAERSRQLGR